MNMMFRWKGMLLIAISIPDARRMIEDTAASAGYSTVSAFEREYTRTFVEDNRYDTIDSYDFLHLVDPEEMIELSAEDVPGQLITTSDKLYSELGGVIITLEARSWGSLLPAGWTLVPEGW